MTTDLGPPELLELDRTEITLDSGQVGQHNDDESEGRLRLGLKVAPQPYCKPNSGLKGGLLPCSPS